MHVKDRFWVVALLALVLGGGVDARASAASSRSTLATGSPGAAPAPDSEAIAARLAALPLRFEANRGQFDPRVSFLARGSGYELFLTPDGATLVLRRGSEGGADESTLLAMHVVGGRPVQPLASEPLPGHGNYFVGSDPSKWRTGVESYALVRYPEVTPGVDVVYYGTEQRRLEYDIVLAPGADPRSVALTFEGAQGIDVDGDGAVLLRLPGGRGIVQPAPVAYQVDDAGRRVRVDVRYSLREGGLGFAVGSFDGRRTLVIDPTMVYSTYLGGVGSDGAYGIAVDSAGDTIVAGTTTSSDFPTSSPEQGVYGGGGRDVTVTKVNAAGTALVYSTYLGGSGDDFANGLAIDAAGEAFVTGATSSANFPTSSPLQGAYGGGFYDGFVAKLNAAGSALVYSTFVGGNGNDQAHGIAVDAAGEIYVAGFTGFHQLSDGRAAAEREPLGDRHGIRHEDQRGGLGICLLDLPRGQRAGPREWHRGRRRGRCVRRGVHVFEQLSDCLAASRYLRRRRERRVRRGAGRDRLEPRLLDLPGGAATTTPTA